MFRAADADDTKDDLAELPVLTRTLSRHTLTSTRFNKTGSSAVRLFSDVVHHSRRTHPSYAPGATPSRTHLEPARTLTHRRTDAPSHCPTPMINPFKEINWKPGSTELRKFSISLIIGFPVIAIVFFLVTWMKNGALPAADFFLKLGGIGAAVGIVSMIIQPLAKLLYPVWYFLAACIGIVLSNLVFMILYYLMFAPLGLFMRFIIRRDPLALRFDRKNATYWLDAPPTPPASRYFSQF